MERPAIGPGRRAICVGRTPNVQEAEAIAQRFELQGYETWVERESQGGVTLYVVWASKEPDILSGTGRMAGGKQ